MQLILFPLVFLFGVSCQRYHLADIGPFDELSTEELDNAYRNLGSYLKKVFVSTHYYLPEHVTSTKFLTAIHTRVIHVALEVPPKEFRQRLPFMRFARIALFTPGKPVVSEYVVSVKKDYLNVTLVREIPSIKRPVDEIESDNLQAFLRNVCSGDFGKFLRRYYGAAFLYMNSSGSSSNECLQGAKSADNPVSYPACLFAMYASPRVTMKKPNRRITTYRLNRIIPPYNQHPIDVHITVDHTEADPHYWLVDSLFVQGKSFSSLHAFLDFSIHRPDSFKEFAIPSKHFQPNHAVQIGPDLCPRSQESNLGHNYQDAFDGIIVGKHVRYGPWSFHLGVRHETGLRVYNATFNGKLFLNEAGLDETVTIYGGNTPFMQSMTSLETMFGVGSLTSELSPGIDCPVDAIYLSVPIIPSLRDGARTVQNGICIYESSADVHDSAIRRHYQEFEDEKPSSNFGYATGKKGKSLYVITIAAIFNYQYSFVNIFSPTGSYASYVVSSGYIHVDNPFSSDHHYGFVKSHFDLRFNLHTHHFLFFVDALGSENTVEQIKVYTEEERGGFGTMNMEVGRLTKESEGQLNGCDPLTRTAICLVKTEDEQRCLNVINVATMPSLVTMNSSRSFPWIRKSVWFTRYKAEELRASSVYNGIDLTDPVVDFATFSNNETLEGDIVMWINVGFLHIPVNEDIPHTPSKNSQIGFILRPSNFFSQSPDSMESKGSIFTVNKREWINGYVPTSHPDCNVNTTGQAK